MSGHVKSYLFGNNTSLDIVDIYTFPYGIKEPENIIKNIVSNPIILFGVIFTILYPSILDINKPGIQVYYYSAMMAILCVILLFIIHVAIVKYIIKTETIEISPEFEVNQRQGNSYSTIYKGHWVSLFAFSPLYAFLMVYLSRKL